MADPLKQPVQTRPTPVKTDGLFYEMLDGPLADQDRLEYGSDHPNTKDFPGFKLCKEVRDGYQRVQRWWACEETLQDTYNDNIRYSDESTAYPVFVRRYVVRRDQYAPRTILQPRAGVLLVTVDNPGQDYTSLPDVTPSAGTSKYVALINELGQVCWVAVLKDGGDTTAPALTFSGGNGTGATATAYVQPQTALLAKQRKLEFGNDDPRSGLFVIHECTYETLPGPEIPKTRFDKETKTDRTTYRQRVAIATAPNPVSAIKIASVSIASPTVITLDYPHGRTIGTTFSVRIAGVTGGTAVDGDRTATFTGANTLTVPVNVAALPTVNTGYLSFLKNSQVIIDSYVQPDEEAGGTTGTLITEAVTLPGGEFSAPEYDDKRSANVNEYRQYVTVGTASRTSGAIYKGQTVEASSVEPQIAGMSLLKTSTILLPGNPSTVFSYDEETGASKQLIRTRVAIGTTPNTIGATHSAGPTRKFTQSKVIEENSVVGVLTSVTSTLPIGRTEIQDGSEPMPATFTYLGPWVIGNDGFLLHGPFLGVNYLLKIHGVSAPGSALITYTWGKDPTTPAISGIFAPISGRSGIGLPVNGQTLHDGYIMTETAAIGTHVVEVMPVSIPAPAAYVTGDSYIAHYTDRPHEGGPLGLWERRVVSYIAT